MTTGRVLTALALWSTLCVALWLSDAQPAVAALGGVVAVVVALVVSAVDLGRASGPPAWPRHRASPPRDAPDPWATQLQAQLVGARRTGSTELRDRLALLSGTDRGGHSPRHYSNTRTLELMLTELEDQ